MAQPIQVTGAANSTGFFNNSIDQSSTDALAALIKSLLNGGDAQRKQQLKDRKQEIDTTRGIRGEYSKDEAFADAADLVNRQQRLALEESLPALTRAAESAGTSGSALRALLIQDASTRAAESSGALGAQQAVQYGQIQAGLSSTLEALTRPDTSNQELLLNAIRTQAEVTRNSMQQFTMAGYNSGPTAVANGVGVVAPGGIQPFDFGTDDSYYRNRMNDLAYDPNRDSSGSGSSGRSNGGGTNTAAGSNKYTIDTDGYGLSQDAFDRYSGSLINGTDLTSLLS